MRVVVTGASGNVGTSVIDALAPDPAIEEIVGVSRRLPRRSFPKVSWVTADVSEDGLVSVFRGAASDRL